MCTTNTTIIDEITQIQLYKPCLKKKGDQQHKRQAYKLLWHEGKFKRTNPFSAVMGAVSTNTTTTHQITQIQLLKPYLKKKGEQQQPVPTRRGENLIGEPVSPSARPGKQR